jgi:hypothetical protein
MVRSQIGRRFSDRRSDVMSATVERVKCACSDCICVVDLKKGIERDGRVYCSDACADHHKSGSGCQHAGCTCHG